VRRTVVATPLTLPDWREVTHSAQERKGYANPTIYLLTSGKKGHDRAHTNQAKGGKREKARYVGIRRRKVSSDSLSRKGRDIESGKGASGHRGKSFRHEKKPMVTSAGGRGLSQETGRGRSADRQKGKKVASRQRKKKGRRLPSKLRSYD